MGVVSHAMSHDLWPAVACFLLLLHPVQAGTATLQGQQVTTHGESQFRGALTGLVLDNGTLLDSAAMAVSVAQGRITVYDETTDAWVGNVGATPIQHSAASSALADALVDGFSPRSNARMLVIATSQAPLDISNADGLTLKAYTGPDQEFPARASADAAWTLHVAQTITGTGPSRNLNVSGSFRLIVWGTSFVLHNSTGDYPMDTGSQDQTIVAQGAVVRHTQRETVLDVAEGHLTLTLEPAWGFYVHNGFTTVTRGSLDTLAPSGINPVDGSAIASGSRRLKLDGPLSATVGPSNGRLQMLFQQFPAAADLDGRVVRPPSAGSPWVAVLSLLALAALPAGAVVHARVRLQRRLRTLDRLVKTRRFPKALVLARRIRRLRPRQPDALVAESLSLLQTRQYIQAAAVLEAEGWTTALEPMRDYLRATAASGQGKRSDALKWLRRCLRSAPDMMSEALANPLLAGLAALAEPRRGNNKLPGSASVDRTRGGKDALPRGT